MAMQNCRVDLPLLEVLYTPLNAGKSLNPPDSDDISSTPCLADILWEQLATDRRNAVKTANTKNSMRFRLALSVIHLSTHSYLSSVSQSDSESPAT